MLITYRYRFYPTRQQADFIDQKMRLARKTYNQLLEWHLNQAGLLRHNQEEQKHLNQDKNDTGQNNQENAQLPAVRRSNLHLIDQLIPEASQCNLVDRTIVLNAIRCFDRNRLRAEQTKGVMHYKSKDRKQTCILYARDVGLSVHPSEIHTRLIGSCAITLTRKPVGTPIQVTFSKTSSGRYYMALLMRKRDTQKSIEKTLQKKSIRIVGLDMGLRYYTTLSNGDQIENPRLLDKQLKSIRRAHQRLSRAEQGSRNCQKRRKQLAVRYEHLRNQRHGFLHRLTTHLVRQYDVICLESLNISDMKKERKRSRQISDAAWRQFKNLLRYKAAWNGKVIIDVPKYFPSSKQCCRCHYLKRDLSLNEREWVCPHCGTEHERDINAAINILAAGARQLLKKYPFINPEALQPALSEKR